MSNTISPMLAVHDAAAAIEFYKTVFGAVEEDERHEWEGKIGHAEFTIGGAKVMIADEFPQFNKSPQTLGGTPVMIYLVVQDVDATAETAAQNGAEIVRKPEDQAFGRTCTLRDPFGHIWFLNSPR